MDKIAGVNWPHNPERYFKANSLKKRSYDRIVRLNDKATDLLKKGYGPETTERKFMRRLFEKAESFDNRLSQIMQESWEGK